MKVQYPCPDDGQPVEFNYVLLMVWEDELQKLARGEPIEWNIIGFGSCAQCEAFGRNPTVRIMFEIEGRDWLEAYALGLNVVTIKRIQDE